MIVSQPTGDGGNVVGAALVVGAGIAGMQSALDLAESGFKVYLVERSPVIGGTMPMLDKTFPTNDCSMCMLSPKLVECGRHLNIEHLTCSELIGLQGEPGRFKATVRRHPRYVDVEKCLGCGACADVCPEEVDSEFNQGLGRRKAIYKPYPQAFPNAYVIDKENCLECGECVEACPTGAIDHGMKEEILELSVGAIILSPGFELCDPAKHGEFGYGNYPNVLTSLQFERMLSASGPYQGHPVRPSDGTVPKRIAFIQCVGSRDAARGQPYCSAVCCMYTTKQTMIAKEHLPGLETTVFYIDIRAFGKDFEKYYERAKNEYGVRYEKCTVSSVKELQQSKNLRLKFRSAGGTIKEEDFDLVVLSLGFQTTRSSRELALAAGVELDEHGFCPAPEFEPGCTSRPGVFACGAFREPKDIPETVSEASTSAARVSALLATARGTLAGVKEYPPEREVGGEKPAVGVFICNCGINIASVVRIAEVVEAARRLPFVRHVEDFLFSCSQDSIQRIRQQIVEHRLNRVVVASCSPRTHAPLFMSSLREAGLNPYLFEQANIREQVSWVHRDRPDEATAKARELVAMAAAKACFLRPVATSRVEINCCALVVGGGVAGITAALSLAGQGFDVYLVEKEEQLGGNARSLHYTLEGNHPQKLLAGLLEELEQNRRVQVYTGTQIVEAAGYPGNYRTVIRHGSDEFELEHGVVIIASGAVEALPEEYLYGKHPGVMTQGELEKKLASGGTGGARAYVMIQCVGSRQEGRPYCSRVCCSQAVKNALKVKELDPAANVFVLYRDIRTYGFQEQYYRQARDRGVIFIQYAPEEKPEVAARGPGITVSVKDRVLGANLTLEADLLILSTGVAPRKDNERLSKLFKLPLNADGFFSEAHLKLRPVDFAAEGMYLCGMAHSPKSLGEAIAQGKAAAARAAILLSREYLESSGIVATVMEEVCKGCGLCLEVCNYNAREIDPETGVALVHEVLCQGCGACVAACPSGASQQKNYEKRQILAMLDAAL